MHVQIAGKKLEVGSALQERIAFGLESRVSKYFNRTGEAFVTVAKPGWAFMVDCSIHLPSGVTLQAHGEGDDGYQAFEQALDKIEKRVRRYKNRLRNHRAKERPARDGGRTDHPGIPGDGAGRGRTTISNRISTARAEMPRRLSRNRTPSIRTMTVSMAVLQLELSDSPAVFFRNASHGRLNMVYRRPDGNFGWVDPEKDG